MSKWWRGPGRRVRGAALIAALGLPLGGVACREPPPAQRSRPILRIGTAFGPLTEPLTKEYRQTLTNVDIQTVPAPNSIDVIHAIQSGTADFGVAYSNDTYAGYWGKDQLSGSSRAIRGVALLQPLSEYLLVRGNSGIHQVTGSTRSRRRRRTEGFLQRDGGTSGHRSVRPEDGRRSKL